MQHTVIARRHAPGKGAPLHPDQLVPECATCPGHCCKGDLIVLHPDEGDDPASYITTVLPHPLQPGRLVQALEHAANGDCIYLETVGWVGRCRVYSRRPVICRTFDCARSFAKLGRAERRRMVRQGLASKDVMDMGRRRLEAMRARGEPL